MKQIIQIHIIFLVAIAHIFGQSVQGTIVKTGDNKVTVYGKPSSDLLNANFENIYIAISMPVQTPHPTITITNNYLTDLDWTFNPSYELNGRIHYDVLGFNNGGATDIDWLAALDNPIVEIEFSSGTGQEIVYLEDLLNGGNFSSSYWYIEINGSGDITNYANMFYGTGAVNTGGSGTSYVPTLEAVNMDVTLALKIKSFTAKKFNKTSSYLQWNVFGGNEVDHFEIYRSTPGASWNYVSTVKNDHMSRNTSFDYIDENVYKGGDNVHFYYKLKIYDQDGRFYYSNIEMVSFDRVDAIDELVLYPNPTSGELNFTLDELKNQTPLSLRIYDIEGKLIYTDDRQYSSGKNRVYDMDEISLKSGVYQLIVEDDLKNRYYKKFVYQK